MESYPSPTSSKLDETVTLSTETSPPVPAYAVPLVRASAGHIILQWLTYAFWSWTLIGLSWMTFIVFFHFIDSSSTAVSMIPYAIASVFVLAPVSVICDLLYIKREPADKTGAPKAIMLVHAILFALFSIGVLIGTVFAFVQLLVDDSSSSSTMATIFSLLVVSILSIATFVRTLNLRASKILPRVYVGFMAVIAIIFIILSFAGPVARAQQLKNDRLIESHLSTIKSDIDNYVDSNKHLPASLSDITVTNDAKPLIDKKLVEYKNEGKITLTQSSEDAPKVSAKIVYPNYNDPQQAFHYQLCVTYLAKNTSDYSGSIDSNAANNGYDSYISTYAHPAGNVCYKIEKTIYN